MHWRGEEESEAVHWHGEEESEAVTHRCIGMGRRRVRLYTQVHWHGEEESEAVHTGALAWGGGE